MTPVTPTPGPAPDPAQPCPLCDGGATFPDPRGRRCAECGLVWGGFTAPELPVLPSEACP